MSHLSKVFTDVEIEVQDRSGFDLSHENLFTARVGTLVPCLCEEVLPGDVFDIGVWFQTKTPPLATPFYGKVDARVEVFACANSVVWAGWKQFIQQRAGYQHSSSVAQSGTSTPTLPQVLVPVNGDAGTAGQLADYLGLRLPKAWAQGTYACNALPFLMYHKIVDDYYRNSLITKPFFNEYYGAASDGVVNTQLRNMPFFGPNVAAAFGSGATGNNGHHLYDLRQRCWAKDAYTTATLKPTFADGVDGANVQLNSQDTFSIRDLRAANALQKFLERSNMSTDYADFVLSHFGVYPSDALMEKPMFLGSVVVPVYTNSVAASTNSTTPQGNPFSCVLGGEAGKSVSVGDGNICSNFKCNWHGFIIGLYSLVPHANYATGIRKYLNVSNATQYAFPEFAGIGDEEVYKGELYSPAAATTGGTLFGYNRRFYRYLYHDDEVHGEFMDGRTLDAFVLSRSFDSSVTLNTQFMEIPTTALDQVLAYSPYYEYPNGGDDGSGESGDEEAGDDAINPIRSIGFQAMVDMYWNIKVLRRLPQSPLPHL